MSENIAKKRNANIEWLRILAMFMVVTLHALGKADLLGAMSGSGKATSYLAWLIEAFAIVAVNLYVLISGYVLTGSKFRTGRFTELLCEILFYSVGGFLIFTVTGIGDKTVTGTYSALQCIFPVHMDTFWFMTSYVVMYLLLPVLNLAVKHMTRKQHGAVVILLGIYECVVKSILPVVLEVDDNGYSVMWFVFLFLTAAYVKLYGLWFIKKPSQGMAMYLINVLLIFIEQVAIDYVMVNLGHLELISGISYDYNHLFTFMASLGLFMWGIKLPEKEGVWANIGIHLAPMALGVYLLHEHIMIRYEWQKWLGVTELGERSVPGFIGGLLLAVLIVYAVGTVVDYVRIWIFKGVKALFRNTKLVEAFGRLDATVNGTENT